MIAISRQCLAFSFCFACVLILSLGSITTAQAQNVHIPDKLIYIRSAPEPARGQVVVLSANTEQVFTIPQQSCADVSERGTYIALSSRSGADLVIHKLDSESVVMELVWDTRWEKCYFHWIGDSLLSFVDKEITTKSYQIDVLTGAISENDYALQTYVPPTYPQLPNWYPGTEVLLSPDGNLILYQRCNGEIETYSDRVDCSGISWQFPAQTGLFMIFDNKKC
jgi:hypothetical protein